jgi:PEP-CTERM motif
MKMFFSKVSALGAVLVVGTAFASADQIKIGSWGSTNVNPGVANTAMVFTGGPAPVTLNGGATSNLNPGGVWGPADQTYAPSSWVSFNTCSQPGSSCIGDNGITTIFAPNGTYSYTTTFNDIAGETYLVNFGVMADDTLDVLLNGTPVANNSVGSPNDDHCESNPPSCLVPTFGTRSFVGTGHETLTFLVAQVGSQSTGFDFDATLTGVPEPSTLMMLGTGLIGAAGTLFRRRKA